MRRPITPCLMLFLAFGIGLHQPLKAQYYFGRNKIQYNRFQWQVLKTQHFDIYFYTGMDSLAEIGAHYAEESYRALQDKFNFNIQNRIPLIFYSSHFHFEETNTYPYLISPSLGGFFEFLKGRVVVPSDGSIPRFRQTIRHELVHVFQQHYTERIVRDHRSSEASGVPLWFVEGLAEYWSEGWSSEAEMVIRDGVLNNTLVPIERMSLIWGTYLMYKEGQAVLKYIAETYGEEKILRILQNVWKASTFSEVMRITLGKSYRELSDDWLYSLKKDIYPLLENSDFPRMAARRITDRGFNTIPAFFRNDTSRSVVFVGNRDGYSNIFQKRLADDEKKDPDILVRGERTPELESFRLQHSKIDVSRDGRLAFVAKSGAQDILYVYDLKAKTVVRQFRLSGLVSLFSPSWSPDGKRLALTGLDRAGKNDLYLLDLATEATDRLTDDFFDDQDPDWSPDGSSLVFASDRMEQDAGHVHLYRIVLRDRRIHPLTHGPYKDHSPAWSEDGKIIVFVSDRSGVPNLWLVAPADSVSNPGGPTDVRIRQATHYTTGVFLPCWTDSSTLVFSAFENFGFQLRELESLPMGTETTVLAAADTGMAWRFPGIGGRYKTEKAHYRKKFSLDFAQSQVIQDPIFGTAGGGELVISDMLGNEQYYFLLYNNARSQSELWDGFNIAATRVNLSRRLNTAIGVYRFSGIYFNYYEGYFYERRYGGYGAMSYPLNKFERVETSINARWSEKDRFERGTLRKALLVSAFASYTKDNSLWGPTGPLDGERINVTVGQTTDVIRSVVNFTTLMGDVRKYFRIGPRMCWAMRLWGQFNLGRDPLPFFMGGSWDLRGYKFWSIWNPKLAFVSNEFRFPFIDEFFLGFPFGGFGISSIRGALFVDAGNAWDREFGDLKGSLGFGIRFQLGGYLVLRFDTGKKTDFKKIYPRTFRQFFFGWDF